MHDQQLGQFPVEFGFTPAEVVQQRFAILDLCMDVGAARNEAICDSKIARRVQRRFTMAIARLDIRPMGEKEVDGSHVSRGSRAHEGGSGILVSGIDADALGEKPLQPRYVSCRRRLMNRHAGHTCECVIVFSGRYQ